MITAKIRCDSKTESGSTVDGSRQARVSFGPDYADNRNREWSLATPTLSLTMTLNGEAADLFDQGKRYTLQFVDDTD